MNSLDNESDRDFIAGLMESLSAGLIAVDRSLRVRTINGRARKILGLAALPPLESVELEDALREHPRLVDLLQGAFQRPSLPSRAEMSLHRNGERKIVGYSMTFIRTQDGEVVGVSLTFKDLTRIEQQAEQERLRKRMEALGHMASRLAHQVRNPIAAINVMTDLIRRRLGAEGGEETDELFQRINHELNNMNITVTECLEYVRSVPVNQQETLLPPLLAEAADQVVLGCEADPATVRIETGRDTPAAMLDNNQMKQVFEIIIRNALEATNNAGPVDIAIERGRDDVTVTIADQGPGLDPDSLERIFYPFFTTKRDGSGIGLSVAQKIVDAHGGRIDVESRVGEGARFRVVVPLRPPMITGVP